MSELAPEKSTKPTKSTSRWIRPLPRNVINKIAAGEVVERPAAVVKELIENSIDASADQIDIIVEKSGAKLLKIVDNGCGISEEQIEIAFSRHATSKISDFRDLDSLDSYGFRGEALPSIASVSRLRMVSRPHDARTAQEIVIEGGVLQSKEPIAAPPGTTIEVENIFYNTPARRKFLKSEAVEARHISRTVSAMAISQPEIGFTYRQNGREIFALPPRSGLKERIAAILSLGKDYVQVFDEQEHVKIEGYVGLPAMALNNRNGLYLFINSRFIQSAVLSHGVRAGYQELIPGGKFPIGALSLTIDPAEVDVNVHPTKIEVRLSHEREIHDAIFRAIRAALKRDGLIPAYQPSGDNLSSRSSSGQVNLSDDKEAISRSYIPGIGSPQPPSADMLTELYKTPDSPVSIPLAEEEKIRLTVDRRTGEIIDDPPVQEGDVGPSSGFRFIGRFSDLYLIIQAGNDLYIVDQHTAHERVLYEEFLAKVDRQSTNSQQLLFPVQVELSPEQLALFDETQELLTNSGFGVSGFGGRTVNIEAMPVVLSKKSPEKVLLAILDDIQSLRKAGLDLKKSIAQSMACRAAVMAGDRLNDQEAVHLLASLLKCENRYSCPHGRPTFIRLSRADLDKQFGRA